jgi:predicted dehydrogenase
MKRIRAGVLSAGAWSETSHLPELVAHEDVELVVVSRPDEMQASRVAKAFGAKYYETDWRRALDRDLDIVIVSSPPAVHEEQVLAALATGAHVLCEKPFALGPESAWRMVDAARSADRYLLLGFGWVATPLFRKAYELISGGELGDIEHVMVHLAVNTRPLLGGATVGGWAGAGTSESRTYTDPAVSGGGAAAVSMSHEFGMLLWLLGRPVSTIAAQTFPNAAALDLHVASVITLLGGGSGAVSCASTHPYSERPQWYVAIYGKNGEIWLDSMLDRIRFVRADGSRWEPDPAGGEGAYRAGAPTAELIKAARGCEPCDGYGAEIGARVVEITSALYRSANEMVPIAVHLREEP